MELDKHGVIDVVRHLIDGAHAADVQVVYTRVAFREGHSDLVANIPLLGVVAQQGSLLLGTDGPEIIAELKPDPRDLVVTSRRSAASPAATWTTSSAPRA